MIHENELRINSWVEFLPGTVFEAGFRRVKQEHFGIAYKYETDLAEHVRPIPLTFEILERCGFGKEGDYFKNSKCIEIQLLYKSGKSGLQYDVEIIEVVVTSIEYLHQLQTLWFAITGEELSVDL